MKTLTVFDLQPTTVDDFTQKVINRTPFAFSKWGDGEWRSVLGVTTGANCDGHQYFAQMGQELRAVLQAFTQQPQYDLAMQPLSIQLFQQRIERFLADNQLQHLRWHDADLFHWAISHPGQYDSFRRFLDALRHRQLVVVGPPHLQEPLKELLSYREFVQVPLRDAYIYLNDIVKRILAAIARCTEPPLVSVSCGMPAEILIHRIWDRASLFSMIDMGSVWDPYCGVKSRSYMRTLAVRDDWQPPR